MKIVLACLLLLALLAANPVPAAEQPGASLPEWLLGEWVVTKIYESASEVYPDPGAEPIVWLNGKTMTVEPNRLSLVGEICAEATAEEKHGTIRHLLKEETGYEPHEIGLKIRGGQVNYSEITCHKSYMELNSDIHERNLGFFLHWHIIRDGNGKIEMPFLGGCYIELRRQSPTS